MILSTFQETELSAGGGPISYVADFIAYKEVDFGPAIQSLEVTVFSKPDSTGGRLRGRDIRQPHDVKLPSVTYRKKGKKFQIKWQSQNLTEDEMLILCLPDMTTSVFIHAVQDVYDALEWGLNKRLSDRDEFDISGCLDWVKAAKTQAPSNDKDLRSVLSVRSEQYLHLIRTHDFHQRFDIDWSSMHEDAAHLLYHPELWNETDARMPHGNVLGKGILDNFTYYEHISIDEILSQLGLRSFEAATVYDDKVKALQVELAFVFAYVKKRGMVPEALADELIRRMMLEMKNKKSFWVYRSRHGTSSHFVWMYNYLEAFTNIHLRSFWKFES